MEPHFLTPWEEKLYSKKDKELMSRGLSIMKKTKDPLHDLAHIFSLKKRYEQFKKDVKMKVDDRIMLNSLIFHDTFKAKHRRAKSGFRLFWDEIYDGIGSAKIFEKQAERVKMDKKLIKEVMYAIKKHASFNILPRTTREAKLLFDLDELDFWNFERFKKSFKVFKFDVNRHFRATMAYLKHRTKKGFYFEWSRRKFERNKPNFIEELKKIVILGKNGLR